MTERFVNKKWFDKYPISFISILLAKEQNFSYMSRNISARVKDCSSSWVKFDTFRRLYHRFLTLPDRISTLCRGQKTKGRKWIPCRGIAGAVDSVRAEYDKSRYKAYPRGGKWRTRAPCCSADDAWRRDTIAFPDSRIICQRPSDAKNSKSILSYVPTICSRSSIIRQQCRWPTRAGSLRSEFPSFLLFSSLFFTIATRATFLIRWSCLGENLYRELKGSWFVDS